ncbi:unnamed protein product [Trichobilharzia regenti]|nr:unnamed protein product [Trichobilharzia regenti]
MPVLPCGYLAFSLCSWFYVQSQEAANCAREFLESVSKEQTDSVLIRDKLNKPKSLENNQHFWSTILSIWTEYGAQFSQAWNYWQSECQHRMSSGEFEHVGGDAISIEYVKLIMVNAEGLSKNLDRWLALTSKENSEPGSNFDQSVDAIITSIFRVDLLSFTHLSSEKLGNCWFIAHFTNLLNHIYPGIFNECLGGHKKGKMLIKYFPKVN